MAWIKIYLFSLILIMTNFKITWHKNLCLLPILNSYSSYNQTQPSSMWNLLDYLEQWFYNNLNYCPLFNLSKLHHLSSSWDTFTKLQVIIEGCWDIFCTADGFFLFFLMCQVKPWIKTSLAPGSGVVKKYLEKRYNQRDEEQWI